MKERIKLEQSMIDDIQNYIIKTRSVSECYLTTQVSPQTLKRIVKEGTCSLHHAEKLADMIRVKKNLAAGIVD